MPRYDLVIFGATGFTGRYTVKNLLKMIKTENLKVTWAIAGRNQAKLKKLAKEISVKLKKNVVEIPIIQADIKNPESINRMTVQAKVIINCVGPYRFYGEDVVNSCIKNRTHHVDVSGEPEYMESIQLKYNVKAMENNVYVVSACGFDSIPADIGTIFLKKMFGGELNTVEIFLDTSSLKRKTSVVNYGTWESAIYGVSNRHELQKIRQELFNEPLPKLLPKYKPKVCIFRSDLMDKKWCTPFPGADRSVVRRSQYFLYLNNKERPAQVGTYLVFPNLFAAVAVVIISAIFLLLTKSKFGRRLLLRYPRLFSFGFASRKGPSAAEAQQTEFSLTIFGEGWTEKVEIGQKFRPPNKRMVVRVSGKNPAYGATSNMLIISALTILDERDRMPFSGGVFSPGAAFENTKIIERLNRSGIKFEVLSSIE